MVEENTTLEKQPITQTDSTIHVKNYWEAAGVAMAMWAGINRDSVRRPLEPTKIDTPLDHIFHTDIVERP